MWTERESVMEVGAGGGIEIVIGAVDCQKGRQKKKETNGLAEVQSDQNQAGRESQRNIQH
jgi:hypothetical protein